MRPIFPPDLPERLRPLWGAVVELLSNLWELTVVKSTLGLLAIFLAYAIFYWLLLLLTRSYFIEIAPFRIWRDPVLPYLPEGLASILVNELLRLQRDVRKHRTAPGSGSSGVAFHKATWQPPIAKRVQLEFKGVSPEVVNEFLRRLFKRHVVITTDAIAHDGQCHLIGRSERVGPWECHSPEAYGAGQRAALRELAVRAMVEILPKAREALANALAYMQSEADKREDYEEALRLAELGLIAMPGHAIQLYNLGHARFKLRESDPAIEAFDQATRKDSQFSWAHAQMGHAYAQRAEAGKDQEPQQDLRQALACFDRAIELDPEDEDFKGARKTIQEYLERLTHSPLERRRPDVEKAAEVD